MSAHTPGPWTFYEENNYGGSVELGSTNVTVALDRADRFTSELVISRDELCANGHLIAAAPDLLAALENLAGLFDALHPNAAQWGDYTKARAAVAKARGGK